jgi:transcription termination/antitermination protein NusG
MSGAIGVTGETACEAAPGGGEWFALATMSRHERFAAFEINSLGIETFFPTIAEIHRWSDRKKKVQVPLLPGYLFIRAEMRPEIRRAVSFIRGVVAFITMGGEPIPIPEDQIASLQQLVGQNVTCTPHRFLQIGQLVRICGGALDGIRGILVRYEGGNRLVISVDSIQRSLAIRVEGYKVEAISM